MLLVDFLDYAKDFLLKWRDGIVDYDEPFDLVPFQPEYLNQTLCEEEYDSDTETVVYQYTDECCATTID